MTNLEINRSETSSALKFSQPTLKHAIVLVFPTKSVKINWVWSSFGSQRMLGFGLTPHLLESTPVTASLLSTLVCQPATPGRTSPCATLQASFPINFSGRPMQAAPIPTQAPTFHCHSVLFLSKLMMMFQSLWIQVSFLHFLFFSSC